MHDEAWARGMTYVAFNTLYNEMEERSITFDAREPLRHRRSLRPRLPAIPAGPPVDRWVGRRPSRPWGASSESLANAERVIEPWVASPASRPTASGPATAPWLPGRARPDRRGARDDRRRPTLSSGRTRCPTHRGACGPPLAAADPTRPAITPHCRPRCHRLAAAMTCETLELLDVGTEALLFAGDVTGPDGRPRPRTTGDSTRAVPTRSWRDRESGSPTARGRQPWVTSSVSRPSPPASATCSSRPGRGSCARPRSSRRGPARGSR